MNKKKNYIIVFLLAISLISVLFVAFSGGQATQPKTEIPNDLQGPSFVVPENPIGTLGIISGFVGAVMAFTIIRRKK